MKQCLPENTPEKHGEARNWDALVGVAGERPRSRDAALQNAIEASYRATKVAVLANEIARKIDHVPAENLAKVTSLLEDYANDLMYLVSRIARYTGADLRWRVVEAVTQPEEHSSEGDVGRGGVR